MARPQAGGGAIAQPLTEGVTDTISRPPRFTRHMHSPFPPRSAIPCAQSSNTYRSSYAMP
ncbi:MAG: hypothetical protein ACTTKJ_08530 [Prevotella koreensis]|uniref:hypothetical protein n=1 Tax=Prevotella koreensis TaxID=2490854 RepID=UPI003FA0FA91